MSTHFGPSHAYGLAPSRIHGTGAGKRPHTVYTGEWLGRSVGTAVASLVASATLSTLAATSPHVKPAARPASSTQPVTCSPPDVMTPPSLVPPSLKCPETVEQVLGKTAARAKLAAASNPCEDGAGASASVADQCSLLMQDTSFDLSSLELLSHCDDGADADRGLLTPSPVDEVASRLRARLGLDEEADRRIRRERAITSLTRYYRCDKPGCMLDIFNMPPPPLERQEAFQFKETVPVNCPTCGEKSELTVYY